MTLLKAIKNLFSSEPVENLDKLGNEKAICPYCDELLEKMPGRKKKCPQCNNFIYVRTRPSDNKRILIRENQIVEIEELWAIKNGTHELFLSEQRKYEKSKNELQQRTGREPTENDIQWSKLNDELFTFAKQYQWGLYRNARLGMGDILKKEAKDLSALDIYLEVCYIDSNGPNNCGSLDPEFLELDPPFNPKKAFLAPGIIANILKLLKKNNLQASDAKQYFYEVAQRTKEDLKLSVEVEDAWEKLEKELM